MSQDVKLPPLPELPIRPMEGWYADDLHDYAREYARLAVLQERVRCAKLCGPAITQIPDHQWRPEGFAGTWVCGGQIINQRTPDQIAAAIRSGE